MGISYAYIEIKDLFHSLRMSVRAWVDSISIFFSVPENIVLQLGLDITKVSTREVMLAACGRKIVPMIGSLRVYFQERYCDLIALVMGDLALFGEVRNEMMDSVLHPATQTFCVNAANPFIPNALAK